MSIPRYLGADALNSVATVTIAAPTIRPTTEAVSFLLDDAGVAETQARINGLIAFTRDLTAGVLRVTGTTAQFSGNVTSAGNLIVGATTDSSLNARASFVGTSGTGRAAIGAISTNGTGALDTGISVNQREGGGCLLLVASRNTDAGTATQAAVYIVRFYYDGNHTPTTTYVGGSSDFVTFGKSASNTLTLTNAGGGNCSYSWFGNK